MVVAPVKLHLIQRSEPHHFRKKKNIWQQFDVAEMNYSEIILYKVEHLLHCNVESLNTIAVILPFEPKFNYVQRPVELCAAKFWDSIA